MRHSPPLLGAMPAAGGLLHVVNCAHYRNDGTAMSCAIGLPAGLSRCMACADRQPLIAITLGGAAVQQQAPQRMRGIGDAVERIVRVAFLGRLDIAHRLAAWVESLVPSRRRPEPAKRKGCGCKARKDALNRAIPFKTNAH
jgi:hypothetical protein